MPGRRGQRQAAFRLIERRWAAWRGRAVEPLIRRSPELAAAAGGLPWPDAEVVGGWWNRQFSPEIDLVGADRAPVARRVLFAGSVKWLAGPFDDHDRAELEAAAPAIPGFVSGRSGLLVVSRSGVAPGGGSAARRPRMGSRRRGCRLAGRLNLGRGGAAGAGEATLDP